MKGPVTCQKVSFWDYKSQNETWENESLGIQMAAVVENAQVLISDDSRQFLRKSA